MNVELFALLFGVVNIENVNRKAPYSVVQIEGFPHLYYFHTDYGVDYEISIKASDIVRKDNPKLRMAIDEFEETVRFLFE
ncbi:hypothetical protein [Prevotella sp. tf2-5]|uniref:hypothetical protein n=1 Tax=Prevotella sp. tf2-5 TaxID=1761889 RepID=UPI0008F2C537|nr:hypothetical protein [Prevotella sp. tf2-5]SFO61609.1 hypothetical protein SAMN04487852_103263 [Prevotella sp. tf2-5]